MTSIQNNNPLKEKITFSLEKGHRYFNQSEAFYNFLVVQFYIQQERIMNNETYHFIFIKNENILYNYDITIHKDKKQVHSKNGLLFVDPLIEADSLFNITFHFPLDIFEKIKSFQDIKVQLVDMNNNVLMEKSINTLKNIFHDIEHAFSKVSWFSQIIQENENICITSKRNCTLTLHLGDDKKNYHEREFYLKENQCFSLLEYIGKYSYLGIQCSYEDIEPEIEEKFILVGLNGMSFTGILQTNKGYIHPIFNYQPQFQQHYKGNELAFTEVFSINDLISHYNHYRHKPIVFPCDHEFIAKHYTKNSTYNQNLIFSANPPPIHPHTISENCQNCSFKSECLQIIPSGLSKELFKKNIALEKYQDCTIFQLIDSSHQ